MCNMPSNDSERSTMTTFLTLISVAMTAVIIGFGAVLFKLLNVIAL